MSDSDNYILNSIRTWVWSGFYSPADVDEMIDDILDEEANEAMLRGNIGLEFQKKAAAEKSWPEVTDCDRLDEAFEEMNNQGIIALQNAGYTMSDGLSDVTEALHERDRDEVQGYCFYHGQDLERAVAGHGLSLAFGALDDDKEKKTQIGHLVKELLEGFGFTVAWNGDSETRLEIPQIDWKRRFVG